MRELLFKNLTSTNTHRRILCMSEIIAEGDIQISTQRRCTYLLKKRIYLKDTVDLSRMRQISSGGRAQKRHFHVIRKCDSRLGENKLFCRVEGLLYVVMGNYVYLIAFTNSFKICMRKVAHSY